MAKRTRKVAPHRAGRPQAATPKKRPPRRGEAERIAARRLQALSLRKAGAPYRAIAAELKVSVETAYSDVQAELAALEALSSTEAENVRQLELRRLDDLQLALSAAVRRGDPQAIRTALLVMERRSKYLGIDAAKKSEISGPGGGPIPVADLTQLSVEQLRARALAIAERSGGGGQ